MAALVNHRQLRTVDDVRTVVERLNGVIYVPEIEK